MLPITIHNYRQGLRGLLGLALCCVPVVAQEDFKNRPAPSRPTVPPSSQRTVPTGQPVTTPASRPSEGFQGRTERERSIAAAREFFGLTEIPAFYERQVQTILQQQLRDSPELRPYSDILQNFLRRHASWQAISEDLAVFLADSFEERELRQLNAFAATSAGRKLFNNLELFGQGKLNEAQLRRLFDEVELKQIETFSRTAVFQKFTERIPTVFEAGGRVIGERIDRHSAELTEAIQRRQRQPRRP
ncbi:hypothetical protein J8C06_12490 [Chloracidobacterium validum]|uniref:DUF2059 domain-containing protein n=1 Tax=Chloracidobacterium validum TaxID=2821543 RepID=A0ABX8BGG4_9BACT|nr:hypothetical protein [Chloracidobacterium validum]QUW04595.1 hypothetical protein J8C06_12490 [Chloracidobacterium validum]